MTLKDITARRGALLLVLLLVAGIAAWAMSPAKGVQIVGAGARWHVVDGGAWSIDHMLLWRMRAKLPAAADASRAQRLAGVAPASAVEWGRYRADVGSYMVQVQGTFDGDRRVVTLSGSCESSPENFDPDAEFLVAADGGNCFFLATFDPVEDRFVRLDFNGPGF